MQTCNVKNNSASANASEQINKADATVKIFNGATDVSNGTAPFTYNALSHGLSATVTGVAAETATLNIDTITYDGITTAPTNVKVVGTQVSQYAVVAKFNGNDNYNSASANEIGRASCRDREDKVVKG